MMVQLCLWTLNVRLWHKPAYVQIFYVKFFLDRVDSDKVNSDWWDWTIRMCKIHSQLEVR